MAEGSIKPYFLDLNRLTLKLHDNTSLKTSNEYVFSYFPVQGDSAFIHLE